MTTRKTYRRPQLLTSLAVAALLGSALTSGVRAGDAVREQGFVPRPNIQHIVVIFQENASFDHYFGTYPDAANVDGTPFMARVGTPSVNNLTDGNSQFPERLATGLHNFNANQPDGTPTGLDPNGGANPFRLNHDQAVTCSNNHDYLDEQLAADSGLMDQFPQQNNANGAGCSTDGSTVMGYFDGNTVTALWTYAQRWSMSDNSWDATYGPSTPGAINLVSGQTGGAILHTFTGTTTGATGQLTDTVQTSSIADTFFVGPTNPTVTADLAGSATPVALQTGTLATDEDPYLDDCGNDHGGTVAKQKTVELTGKNVGDLLNAKGLTWGWFAGGFRTATKANPVTTNTTNPQQGVNNDPFGTVIFGGAANDGQAQNVGQPNFVPAVCNAAHVLHPDSTQSFTGSTVNTVRTDYNPHHSPFQYYASTRNPHHLPPTSVAAIGHQDQANHQYDLLDFYSALAAGNLPTVSFLKGINRDDGHPGGESDPLSEQRFLVQTINLIERSPFWNNTVVFIAWDDSDGWYDHALPPLENPSAAAGFDALSPANGGNCGSPKADALQARCRFGPRLPLNIISPWAKINHVDHTVTDQTSVLRFIEDQFKLAYIDGTANVDPTNGQRIPGFPLAPEKQSFDVITGSLDSNFLRVPVPARIFLDPVTGLVIQED
jgi:phospholipase C